MNWLNCVVFIGFFAASAGCAKDQHRPFFHRFRHGGGLPDQDRALHFTPGASAMTASHSEYPQSLSKQIFARLAAVVSAVRQRFLAGANRWILHYPDGQPIIRPFSRGELFPSQQMLRHTFRNWPFTTKITQHETIVRGGLPEV
jgi:hypothetical protein